MKTTVNVTRQSNLPVLYGSEMPGIWLINWNITMHLDKVRRSEENPYLGFNRKTLLRRVSPTACSP